MNTVVAIARHMIAEGIRMKIAFVFLLLIGAVVLGLPFAVVGDGSLTGAVQSFMTYGLSATSLFLALLTIFLSRSVADEFVHRQIFLVLTKPVSRWQYVVGKWVGICTLNAVFLVCSGLTIAGMVYYIRSTHPPIDENFDKNTLDNEVLVARHALKCEPPDFTMLAKREFERNREEGLYDGQPDFDAEKTESSLQKKYEARWRVVGPGDHRVFEFSNVLVDRSEGNWIQLRYKTEVSGYPPDEIFRATFFAGNPQKGTGRYARRVRHVVGRFHTVRFPAAVVAPDNTLTVQFVNQNPFDGEPQFRNVIDFKRANEVEILFIVGSFGGNLFRLLALIMCKLMFLAAVAILMTSVFSFPVACLGSLTVFVLAATRKFILEALDFASSDFATMFSSAYAFLIQLIMHVYNTVHWIVPDFARYDAVEHFVNGRNVGLAWVLDAVFWLVLVKTGVVLGAAVLLFHRRELAEVSV